MRLIDADALFDRVYKEYGQALDEGPANLFMGWISEAPTIDPESLRPQWIPVTEGLPEERQPVYIRLDNGNVFRAEIRMRELLKEWWYHYDETEDMDMLGTIYEVKGWLKDNPVVEWIPLLEPYCEPTQNGKCEIEIQQTNRWVETV